ncbi:MAG: tyrosine-protein kinase family protein [Gammaproteobacteria bacterium]
MRAVVKPSVGVSRSRAADTPEWCLSSVGQSRGFHDEAILVGLFQKLDTLLPPSGPRIVAFMGPKGGEGVTTLVEDLAYCVTARLGKAVLVIEAEPPVEIGRELAQREKRSDSDPAIDLTTARDAFGYGRSGGGLVSTQTEKGLLTPRRDKEKAVHPVEGVSLYALKASLADITPAPLETLLDGVGQPLDLVIIDSPSAAQRQTMLAISRCTDAVVLVLDANRIDPVTTEEVIAELRGLGVRVLGLVLNRAKSAPGL